MTYLEIVENRDMKKSGEVMVGDCFKGVIKGPVLALKLKRVLIGRLGLLRL